MAAAHDDEEYVQMTVPEVFVYKIPPRTSAQGHKASDWKDQVAVCKLQVVTKGADCAVKLINNASGKVFAIAPVRLGGPQAVEQVTDSSRYYCLRIEDGKGNHAFIGVGFNQRSDAFDFKSALADYEKATEQAEKGVDLGLGPLGEDFSLKAGQTFTIKLGGTSAAGPSASSAAAGSGGLGRLAPPGAGGLKPLRAPGAAAPAPAAAAAAGGAGAGADPFGFGAAAVPAPAPAAAAPAPASGGGDWVSFD